MFIRIKPPRSVDNFGNPTPGSPEPAEVTINSDYIRHYVASPTTPTVLVIEMTDGKKMYAVAAKSDLDAVLGAKPITRQQQAAGVSV